MPKIELLTFDLDDTLWDVKSIILRADREMMRWLEAHYPRLTADFDQAAFMALRAQIFEAHPDIRHDLGELRRRTLEQALRRSGHGEAEAQAGARDAFAVFFRERNIVEFFPEVLPTLARLKKDYTLYALSNGGADIAHMGLGHLFSLHLSAVSVGAAKPDPAMYVRALELANIRPEQAIHIGDHPEQDIAAAQRVGMRTIWANYAGKDWPLENAADAEIRSIGELPEAIRRLDPGRLA